MRIFGIENGLVIMDFNVFNCEILIGDGKDGVGEECVKVDGFKKC